jgi:hypothetical protein
VRFPLYPESRGGNGTKNIQYEPDDNLSSTDCLKFCTLSHDKISGILVNVHSL